MIPQRKIPIVQETAPEPIDIESAIPVMRDSVWVIQSELLKDEHKEKKGVISRNVAHLKLMLENPQVTESGQDLSDITAAIEAGEIYLNATES